MLHLLFQGHSASSEANSLFKLKPNTFLNCEWAFLSDKATHLNIKGIVQGSSPPPLTGKSSNREIKRDFRGLTYLCGKKLEL